MAIKNQKSKIKNRSGFTLIELLIVIIIIAVLAALVTGVVLRIMDVGPQVSTTQEIRQLELAVENFKQKLGQYPPSKVTLPPTADAASQAYINAIWRRIDFSVCNWGNTGTVTLEGDQCLVYFLRGPTGNGWSTNPINPTDTTGTTRIGPFFEFPTDRLFDRAGTGFVSFADPYMTPAQKRAYAFLSSYLRRNGYVDTDCTSLGVSAYYQPGTSPKRYYNPNSFQIISAGKNFNFGRGQAWAAGGASSGGSPSTFPGDYNDQTASGFDDLSNFWGNMLGVP